jgi:hypothetical protein
MGRQQPQQIWSIKRQGNEQVPNESDCADFCADRTPQQAAQRAVSALVAKSKMIDGSAVSAASALCRLLCGRCARSVPTIPAFPTGENAPKCVLDLFLIGARSHASAGQYPKLSFARRRVIWSCWTN